MSLCKSAMDLVRDLLLRNRIGQSDGMPLPGLGYKRRWLLSCSYSFTLSHLLLLMGAGYHVLSWPLGKFMLPGAEGVYLPAPSEEGDSQSTAHRNTNPANDYKSEFGSGSFPSWAFRWDPSSGQHFDFILRDPEADNAAKLLLDTWPIETVSNKCFKPLSLDFKVIFTS